jgi:hypothetical protein
MLVIQFQKCWSVIKYKRHTKKKQIPSLLWRFYHTQVMDEMWIFRITSLQ